MDGEIEVRDGRVRVTVAHQAPRCPLCLQPMVLSGEEDAFSKALGLAVVRLTWECETCLQGAPE